MTEHSKICRRLLLSGKVQGVSFRFYTHEKAVELGLTGWVRNLDDGRVEMLISGSPSDVQALEKWAHKGPPGAHVAHLEALDVKENFPRDPFFIRRDGGK